jgi:hypothetical protein
LFTADCGLRSNLFENDRRTMTTQPSLSPPPWCFALVSSTTTTAKTTWGVAPEINSLPLVSSRELTHSLRTTEQRSVLFENDRRFFLRTMTTQPSLSPPPWTFALVSSTTTILHRWQCWRLLLPNWQTQQWRPIPMPQKLWLQVKSIIKAQGKGYF